MPNVQQVHEMTALPFFGYDPIKECWAVLEETNLKMPTK
jgi:hypothetical protein